MRTALMCSVAFVVGMAAPPAALAQQAPPSNAPAPSDTSPATEPQADTAAAVAAQATPENGLGDIIVTAQRRSENLQRAAVPVDVVSAASLLKNGVVGPDSLGALVPALTATPAGGSRVNFFLRGVGNFTANASFDSSIAFNYDSVYLGRPGATGGLFYDLERVEVLKGPQGTLYGRNATGGAINVIPVHPKAGELSGYLTGSYGNYNAIGIEGAVNVPLGPDGALRVSGNVVKHDGYLSDGTFDDDTKALRVQMQGRLTPNLTVRVSGDYASVRGVGAGTTYVNRYSYNPAAGQYVVNDSGLGPSVGIYDPAAQAFRRTLRAGPAGRNAVDIAPYPYVHNDYYGANAEINLTTGAGTLTVIPAWRYGKSNNISDTFGFTAKVDQTDEQYSTEARFAGNRIGAFDYTLGGLYYNERNKGHYAIGQQALVNFQDIDQKLTSYAAFTRVTAHLTDIFRLVGGLRYTHDRKTFNGSSDGITLVCAAPACPTVTLLPQRDYPEQLGVPLPVPGGVLPLIGTGAIVVRAPLKVVNQGFNTGRITYRGAVEFDVGPHSLLYASVETGFRSGGLQPVTGYEVYKPETITAYTVGSKNRFFDNRLQLNAEAFLWKYRDQQLASITVDLANRQGFFVKNIGRSTIYGAEVEARLLATPSTILSIQGQYLHTKYDSFNYTVPTGTAPPFTTCASSINATNPAVRDVDCSGNPAYNAPRWTVNLGVDQTFHLGDFKFVASADSQYRSSRYVGFEFAQGQLVGSTWQTNAQLSFGPESDTWSIAGYIRNIENDRFAINSNTFAIGSAVVATTNPPRTYGVRGSVKF
jgi:iron complex outermembrane receptor protein